jgi:hypothetical protein
MDRARAVPVGGFDAKLLGISANACVALRIAGVLIFCLRAHIFMRSQAVSAWKASRSVPASMRWQRALITVLGRLEYFHQFPDQSTQIVTSLGKPVRCALALLALGR